MILFPYTKLSYDTSTPTSVLEEKIDIHKTPGMSDKEEPSEFSGNFLKDSFYIRRVYRGGINFFIPVVIGRLEQNTLNTKIRFTKATNSFLIFSILLAFVLLFAPFFQEKPETEGLNIKGTIIILIPYALGIIYFWYEYYLAKKFLLSVFRKL